MGIETEILEWIVSKLCPNNDLETWCQAQFAKKHTVFLGVNSIEPPGENSAPFIAVYGVDQEIAEDNLRLYICTMGVFVKSNIVLNQVNATVYDNLEYLDGLKKAEELREKVENILLAKKVCPWGINKDAETHMDNRFPLFGSYFRLFFKVISSRR